MAVSKKMTLRSHEYLHVVIVIVALLLTLERLDADTVVELAEIIDEEMPGSVAPTRTAIMKPVPGT